jgi:response regulator NasT
MKKPGRSFRIAVADDEPEMRQFFQMVLPHLGHEVVAVAENGRQLIDQCRQTLPDLVISDIRMPDLDGLEAVAVLNRERQLPVILVTAHTAADFLARASEGPVMAYLAKPIKPVDLQVAIPVAMTRFEEYHKLRQDAASLRQALEDRKIVERAKGVVMKRLGVDEPEAFARLKKLASDGNRKLVQVAETVLTADEVFQALERV